MDYPKGIGSENARTERRRPLRSIECSHRPCQQGTPAKRTRIQNETRQRHKLPKFISLAGLKKKTSIGKP